MSEVSEFDIAVVGGGLHGVSIAAEAASRGLRVVLLQGGDLASGPTGSMRSVLRGGLRKLEKLRVASVNQNLYEIALLKTKAPHLLRFHKFHIHDQPKLRSRARIQRGLKIYRFLQQRQLRKAGIEESLDANATENLCYYEYQLANARLILTLAQQAASLGASIRPYNRVVSSMRAPEHWLLEIADKNTEAHYSIKAGILVNCCGWLANRFLHDILQVPTRCKAEVSHYAQLVIRKPKPFHEGKVFQLDDGKLLYAHNLDDERFILGPLFAKENTEHARNVAIEEAMQIWNSSTSTLITLADIEYSSWTSRAKPGDPLSNENGVYRECLLDLNNPGKVAPLLNVFGMQTVRHRLLAAQAIEILQAFTGAKKHSDFASQALPGGEFIGGLQNFIDEYKQKLPNALHPTVERMVAAYGSLSQSLLDALVANSQGEDFGHGLFEAEVRYLLENEWATSAEDILWRRSSLGLNFTEEEVNALNTWIKNRKHAE